MPNSFGLYNIELIKISPFNLSYSKYQACVNIKNGLKMVVVEQIGLDKSILFPNIFIALKVRIVLMFLLTFALITN